MRLRGAHEGLMLALVTTPAATPPAYWYVAALSFAVAGVIIVVTSPLTWLAVVAFVASVLWVALGVRAARRRR